MQRSVPSLLGVGLWAVCLIEVQVLAWSSGSANYTIEAASLDAGGGGVSSLDYSAHVSLEGLNLPVSAGTGYVLEGGVIPPLAGAAGVMGRHVFYNQSAWDGNNPGADQYDDLAIATDKTALLPGGRATFVNYTSYSKGINGVMVDVAALPAAVSASDFELHVGNNSTPSSWVAGPAPAVVDVRWGAGVGGADRVTLIWPNNAIQKQWLEVTMRANEKTGLAEPDMFYFGNAIGEVGDSSADANVLVNDALQVLYNMQTSVPITSRFDVDREGNVLVNDALVCLYNMASGSQALQLINLGGGGGAGSNFETGDGTASSPRQNMAGYVDRRGLLEAVGLAGFETESGTGPGGEEAHLRLLAVEWLDGGTSRLLFDWRGPLPARVWRATDLEGSGWEPLPQAAVSVVTWPLVTVDVPLEEDQQHAFFRFEVLVEQ